MHLTRHLNGENKTWRQNFQANLRILPFPKSKLQFWEDLFTRLSYIHYKTLLQGVSSFWPTESSDTLLIVLHICLRKESFKITKSFRRNSSIKVTLTTWPSIFGSFKLGVATLMFVLRSKHSFEPKRENKLEL